jgi:hypothetical protein
MSYGIRKYFILLDPLNIKKKGGGERDPSRGSLESECQGKLFWKHLLVVSEND